jgi:hypothetical protein
MNGESWGADGEVPTLTGDTWAALDHWLETRNTPVVLAGAPLGVSARPSPHPSCSAAQRAGTSVVARAPYVVGVH